MNIINILEEIEKVDGDVYERLSPRRNAMKEFFGMGSKIAMAAMPLAVGSMFKKAYGQTIPSGVLGVLQYALTLEHFEAKFYVDGYAAYSGSSAVSATDKAALLAIRDSESKHVTFLQSVISAAGATPVSAKAAYDFSGGTGTPAGAGNGPFKTAFTNYSLFLAVAQTLEDTGVRAYKGRAGELVGQKVYLTAALGIHAVEARHAAKIRNMRRVNNFAPDLKSYITGGNDSGTSLVDANYAGEENTTQAGINIVNINGQNISVKAATEAFDEPLTAAQVLALVAPFGVS